MPAAKRLVLDGRRPDDRRTCPLPSPATRIASIATCICSWPNITAPSMTSSGQPVGLRLHHQHGVLRAGDDEVELRLLQLGARRIQQVLAVLVADARGADRAHERQARQASAAEAPSSDGMSGSTSVFIDNTVAMTCTSRR